MQEVFVVVPTTGCRTFNNRSVACGSSQPFVTADLSLALKKYSEEVDKAVSSFSKEKQEELEIRKEEKIPPQSGQDFIDMTMLSVRLNAIKLLNRFCCAGFDMVQTVELFICITEA